MIFLSSKLKRLRRESAPEAAYKAALRSRLVAGAPVVVYSARTTTWRYAFAASALAVIVLLGTSTYAYASSAVTEGDALYPLKTKIENVEGSFKTSPEAQARFHAKLLRRRMQEMAHQLNHHEPLPPQAIDTLAQALNMSVAELHDLRQDESGRQLVKTEVKAKMTSSLTEFRSKVELSDLPQDQKDRYLEAIDARLNRIQNIPATAP